MVMQTYTGRAVDPLNISPSDVCLEDIAHHLSMRCRYGGACHTRYSVAEHCYLLSFHVPDELKLHALLHDAAEAYCGDLIAPIKHNPDCPFADEWVQMEASIQTAIWKALDLPLRAMGKIKAAENRLRVNEAYALMKYPEISLRDLVPRPDPLGVSILCYPPAYARELFIARFQELKLEAPK